LELPRIWRVPAETLRRWGHAMTGMTIRWFTFVFLEKGPADFPFYKIVHYIVIRILLNAEFFYYFYTGHLALWIAQFTATVWWNLFLIVSSHDFDLDAAKADPTNDWGTF
jgi:hypothetical protein